MSTFAVVVAVVLDAVAAVAAALYWRLQSSLVHDHSQTASIRCLTAIC